MRDIRNNRFLALVLLILVLLINLPLTIYAQSEVKIQIVADNVKIYAGPGTVYPVLGTVSQPGKTVLSGISTDGAWFMFAYANGQGWIPNDLTVSKVISGSVDTLPVVEPDGPNAAVDTVNATPVPNGFSRSQLNALVGKVNCARRSMVKPLQKIASGIVSASKHLDKANPDSYVIVLEGILNTYRSTSDISDCIPTRVLCEGVAGRDGCYFEFASIVRIGLSEALIASLYTKDDQSSKAQVHSTRATILITRWDTLAQELVKSQQKRYDPICTKISASKLEDGVKVIYNTLDGEFGTQLDAKQYDEALKILEGLRSDWTSVGNLEACDPKLVKLTGMVNTLLDETFIAALYLKFGNKSMFTKHARLGIRAAQYINGLVAG